jgi:hypothetical protein
MAFAYSLDFPDKMSFEQRLWCIGKIREIGDATVQLSPDCLSKLTSRELAGATLIALQDEEQRRPPIALPTSERSPKTS